MELVNIGYRNYVQVNKIVATVSAESAPIKRTIKEAKDMGMLIDSTFGRKTRAVIITNSGHVILSAVVPKTIAERISGKEDLDKDPEDEVEG